MLFCDVILEMQQVVHSTALPGDTATTTPKWHYTLGLGPFTGSAFAFSADGWSNADTSSCTCAS